jgi:hypothetical protein
MSEVGVVKCPQTKKKVGVVNCVTFFSSEMGSLAAALICIMMHTIFYCKVPRFGTLQSWMTEG